MAERANLSRVGTAAVLAVALLAAGCSGGRPMGLRTDTSSPTDSAESEGREHQSDMDGDVMVVQAYGAMHPEEYGGIRFGDGVRTNDVIASFTRNLDGHKAALLERVEHPDRVDVELAVLSKAEQDRVSASLADLGTLGYSVDHRGVTVWLRSFQRPLADEILNRFAGIPVEIALGVLAYPDPGSSARCEALPASDARDLRAMAEPLAKELTAGDAGGGEVVVRNLGSEKIGMFTGTSLHALLLDGSGRVVASPHWAETLAGRVSSAPPGGSARIPFGFSTDSCRPELGWMLPPGDYTLVVVVTFSDPDDPSQDTGPPPRTVLSEPITIRVLPRAS